MTKIKENLGYLESMIDKALAKSNRNFEDITLVAVTKNVEVKRIKEAIDGGVRVVGENRVKEAKEKFSEIMERVKKHFIGHLQTNKVKEALEIFDLIQSVESERLIEKINEEAEKKGKKIEILIQVNPAEEKNKFGLNSSKVISFIKKYSGLSNVKILGLMMMTPFADSPEEARLYFRQTKELYDRIVEEEISGIEMKYLSMGMSNDFEVALEEGANMIRIGTAIFQ